MIKQLAQGLVDILYHSFQMLTFTGSRDDLKKSHIGAIAFWCLMSIVASTWIRVQISNVQTTASDYENAGLIVAMVLILVAAWYFFVRFLKGRVGVAACSGLFLAFNLYSAILLATHYFQTTPLVFTDFEATRFILFSLMAACNILAFAYLSRKPNSTQTSN